VAASGGTLYQPFASKVTRKSKRSRSTPEKFVPGPAGPDGGSSAILSPGTVFTVRRHAWRNRKEFVALTVKAIGLPAFL
jgi:hypothetical protein